MVVAAIDAERGGGRGLTLRSILERRRLPWVAALLLVAAGLMAIRLAGPTVAPEAAAHSHRSAVSTEASGGVDRPSPSHRLMGSGHPTPTPTAMASRSSTPAASSASFGPSAPAPTLPPATPGPTPRPPAPTPTSPVASAILVGAGDIATCGGSGDEATAALLDGIQGTIFTAGDNAYSDGTAAEFAECFAPSWGRHKSRIYPAPGNHDYHVAGAPGYYGYFGDRAGGPGGYYAYDLGAWRIYSLNSEIVSDAQVVWLRADLAAHPRACVAAYWHHPLFSSGRHGNDESVRPFWDVLHAAGAELVLNGHDHDYERFAPQTPSGQAATGGIREIVVGTGGAGLRPFEGARPNSQVRDAGTNGVLKLTLSAVGYRWDFVPTGGSFTDTGTGVCH
jgi:hypothetical protein